MSHHMDADWFVSANFFWPQGSYNESMKKATLIGGVLVLALAAGGAWWWTQRGKADAVQYRTAKIERGPLQATVSASGAVNPVTQVSVGTQVSGQIKELYVDFNSEVQAGQLIAQIDPETFEYRVRQSQADVDAARAAVLTAQANAAAARAAVSRAKVDLQEAQRDLDRKQSLVEKQFIAQSEADRARALVNTTGESVKSVEAQVNVTEAQVKSAQANVAQREAALSQARVDLQRTRITSPVNGIVIKRAIEKGQTVAASLQSPELFVIAQNLQDMQVDASIDESDVGRIRTGQKASFTVDAFPGQTFEGDVSQVRKAAQNVANVVTYTAVIRFSNLGNRLLPGMTANVRLITDQRESVLKVPNAALRVRIAGVEPEPAPGSSTPAVTPPAKATTTGGLRWMGEAFAQPAGGAGGGMAAMRDRLVTELKLNPEQVEKLDAIGADMRPKFIAMRELEEGERRAVREKLMGEMRGRINAMLDAGQRTQYAQILAQGQGERAAAASRSDTAAAPATAKPGAPASAPTGDKASPGKSIDAASAGPASSAPANAAAASSAAAAAAGPAVPAPIGPQAPAIAGQGPMVEIRNRLVSELRMDVAQAEKLDALYATARPKFMALRDLPEEERGKARERISGDLRTQINTILSPEQQQRYAVIVAENAGRQASRGRIYLMDEKGKPRALNVRLGISDGTSTELLVGPDSPNAADLVEGAVVVIGTTGGATAATRPPAGGPRLPF